MGGGNNSARWTAPGQKRKINIEQLSGYEQLEYPIADELDISKEKHHWIGGGTTKKYHNKVRAVRTENGSLTLEKKTTMKLTKTQLREIIKEEISFTRNLSKKDTALRLSKTALNQIVKTIDEYKKGKFDEKAFAGIMTKYKSDCVDALKAITLS